MQCQIAVRGRYIIFATYAFVLKFENHYFHLWLIHFVHDDGRENYEL